jgi:hypothetical protein
MSDRDFLLNAPSIAVRSPGRLTLHQAQITGLASRYDGRLFKKAVYSVDIARRALATIDKAERRITAQGQ